MDEGDKFTLWVPCVCQKEYFHKSLLEIFFLARSEDATHIVQWPVPAANTSAKQDAKQVLLLLLLSFLLLLFFFVLLMLFVCLFYVGHIELNVRSILLMQSNFGQKYFWKKYNCGQLSKVTLFKSYLQWKQIVHSRANACYDARFI